MVAVAVVVPDVPVIVTVLVPVVAVDEAVKVKVDVALPFAGGVTGLVENAAVTPLGNPDTLSVVAELNPF
jgi:predicted cation transporter